MCEKYPFPLSERTEEELNASMGELFGPWRWMEECAARPGSPEFLVHAHQWLEDVGGLFQCLKDKCYDLPVIPADAPEAKHHERRIFHGVLVATEAKLEQLDGLIKWAELTWRDDPAIKALSEEARELSQ